MECIWEINVGSLNPGNYQDPRDRMVKDVNRIKKELEAQKERFESLQWQYTVYKKKSEEAGKE